ncbi:MAG: ankyrin repeat domain-containing protein [Verrucomicrobia bacterium]|nr:ankyrin repeat domain-containing protein [Verrucomicrobiota bacterium]
MTDLRPACYQVGVVFKETLLPVGFQIAALFGMILFYQSSPAALPPGLEPQVQEAFFQAMLANDTNTALKLLSVNTNLAHAPHHSNKLPLLVATSQGHLEIVELLLKLGADVNAEGDTWNTGNKRLTALDVAIWYNHPSICKRLLAARPDLNHLSPWDGSALHMAFAYKRDEMAGWLLDQGADPFLVGGSPYRKITPFELAITQGDGKLVPRMLADERQRHRVEQFLSANGAGLLTAAALRGQVEALDALLQAGVTAEQTTADNRTLMQAVALASATAPRSPSDSAERWSRIRDRLQKAGADYDVLAATGFGDLDTARRLLAADKSVVRATDHGGDTALHWAVRTDRLPLTSFWLEAGVAPTATNFAGQTALHLAAAQGLAGHVTRLIAARSPTDVSDTNGWTPLNAAIEARQPATIRLLLNTNQTGTTAARGIAISLHEAAASGNIVALAALVNATNIEARNELGCTPFHLAMQNGQLGAAALLLDRGADVNARDPEGNTALLQIIGKWGYSILGLPSAGWFARRNQTSEKAAHLSARTEKADDGWSRSLVQATGFLLASGADGSATNQAGKSAMQLAMESPTSAFLRERTELLKLLGRSGADLDERDEYGDTALHRAAREYSDEHVTELIAGGTSLNATNRLGRTPLHASVEKLGGWGAEPIEALLRAKPDVNAQDHAGLTPLHVLAMSESYYKREATRALLEAGADPKIRDRRGRTAMHLLLAGKWPWDNAEQCIALLAAGGLDVAAADDQGRTLLHYLAAVGHGSPMFFIRNLTNQISLPNFDVNAADRDGNTALHLAARHGTADVFEWLCQQGAKLDLTNAAGETPRLLASSNRDRFTRFRLPPSEDIFAAAQRGDLETLRRLTTTDARLVQTINQSGETPLRVAARNHQTNAVTLLLEHGAAWDEISAARLGRAAVLREILVRRPEVITNTVYGTPLTHLVTESDDVTTLKVLLAAGAAVNGSDPTGLSVLGAARLRHCGDMIKALRARGATENIFDAIRLDLPDTAAALIARKRSLSQAPNAQGFMPLHLAAAFDREQILRLLLDDHVPPDLRHERSGVTALHVAAVCHRTNAAAQLLQAKAAAESVDFAGFAPLHYAAACGSADVAAVLLRHGAQPNMITKPATRGTDPMWRRFPAQSTALHLAALAGQADVIEILLRAGANVNATNADGLTPLDMTQQPGRIVPGFALQMTFVQMNAPGLTNRVARVPMPPQTQTAARLLEQAGARSRQPARSGWPR